MNTLETPYSPGVDQFPLYPDEAKLQQRADSLHNFERRLESDTSEHQWWSFFDGGAQDENGATWAAYNVLSKEEQPEGWKVIYCAPDQTEFHEMTIDEVVKQDVYPPKVDKHGLVTFQLYVRDETVGLRNNDALNVLVYYNEHEMKPKLRMWNHKTNMVPAGLQSPAAYQEVDESYEDQDRLLAAD